MRKNFGITIFVLLALFAVIAGGGCGGGGSGSTAEEPGVLLGTLNGRLAPYLREALNSLGGVVLLSGSEGLNANLPQLRASFDQGQAIALVSADTGDVNVLLNALSIDVASPKTQDEREFDLFAVRKKNGKHHFFVTLHHEEDTPGSATKRTITIIGPEDNPTSVDVTEEPVKKNSGLDNDTIHRGRVRNFVAWNRELKTAAAETKVKTAGSTSSELQDLAEAYVWDIDASYQGQTFTIRYTLYSCHSFTNNMDYYFVTQSAQLNPSVLWKWIEHGHVSYPNIYLPEQEGHMRRYLFKNYWISDADPGTAPLDKTSPENANNVSTVTSGMSWSMSGTFGFNAVQGPNGSMSTGMTFNSSQSFSVSDCTVNNKCGSEYKHTAEWEYDFANPSNGSTEFYYTKLNDAPLLSRSNFQPVNQWVWTVPRTFSEAVDSFKSEFTWTNGHSEGQLNCAWIKVDDAKHTDKFWRYLGFWVPVKRPPLMAISTGQMDFTKAGASQAATFVSAVDWTAESSASWLSVQETSGTKTNADGITIHITASPNDSGANREGTVTLRNADGSQTQTLKVFQSQY